MTVTEIRSTPEEISALRDIWLFSACSDSELRTISALCTAIDVPAGRTLIHEDGPDEPCFVVLRGQVVVERAGHLIGHAVPGSILGVRGLIERGASSATAFAVTDMQVLAIDRVGLAELFASGEAWSVAHRLEVVATECDRPV